MAVNLIVLAVTLLMAAFLGVWIFFPRLRAWMEMPKYRFLERQRQFLGVFRDFWCVPGSSAHEGGTVSAGGAAPMIVCIELVQQNLETTVYQGFNRILADATASVFRPCSGATGCSVYLTLTILTPSNNEFRCLFLAARNFPLHYQVFHFSVTI